MLGELLVALVGFLAWLIYRVSSFVLWLVGLVAFVWQLILAVALLGSVAALLLFFYALVSLFLAGMARG